jgi:hypothetical protein
MSNENRCCVSDFVPRCAIKRKRCGASRCKDSAAAHSAERDRDQAAAQQREAGCGKDEESLGSDITVVTHDTPVASAPGNGANQLIKDVGIPASRERPVLELPSFQPDPFPFAAIDRATPARRQANTMRLQVKETDAGLVAIRTPR